MFDQLAAEVRHDLSLFRKELAASGPTFPKRTAAVQRHCEYASSAHDAKHGAPVTDPSSEPSSCTAVSELVYSGRTQTAAALAGFLSGLQEKYHPSPDGHGTPDTFGRPGRPHKDGAEEAKTDQAYWMRLQHLLRQNGALPCQPSQQQQQQQRAEEQAASPADLCTAVGEVIAQHARRGDLVDDLLRALEAAKRAERQTAACLQALTREREEAVEAAAEQQVLAARHRAAQQETAAEAKQLRAEVRKLTQQLATSRHSSRSSTAGSEPALSPEASQPFGKQTGRHSRQEAKSSTAGGMDASSAKQRQMQSSLEAPDGARQLRQLEDEVATLQLELQARPTLQLHQSLQRQLLALKHRHGHGAASEEPAEWAQGTMQQLRSSLKLADVSLVPQAVNLLQSAAAAVPHMEHFVQDVCKVVFEDGRALVPPGAQEPSAVPAVLTQWLQLLQQSPAQTTLRLQALTKTQTRHDAAPGAAADAPLESMIVQHFQHLFNCRDVEGVLPAMNQVYLALNEAAAFKTNLTASLQAPATASWTELSDRCADTLNMTQAKDRSAPLVAKSIIAHRPIHSFDGRERPPTATAWEIAH